MSRSPEAIGLVPWNEVDPRVKALAVDGTSLLDPDAANPDQEDRDGDGIGAACDSDDGASGCQSQTSGPGHTRDMRERALEDVHTSPQVHELSHGAVRACPRRLRGQGPRLWEADQREPQHAPRELPPPPQPPLHGAHLIFQGLKALEQVIHGASSSVAWLGQGGQTRLGGGANIAGRGERVNRWAVPTVQRAE